MKLSLYVIIKIKFLFIIYFLLFWFEQNKCSLNCVFIYKHFFNCKTISTTKIYHSIHVFYRIFPLKSNTLDLLPLNSLQVQNFHKVTSFKLSWFLFSISKYFFSNTSSLPISFIYFPNCSLCLFSIFTIIILLPILSLRLNFK